MKDSTRYTGSQLAAAESRLLSMIDAGKQPDEGIAEMSDDDLLIEAEAIRRLLTRMEQPR